ncbi:MAG: ribulose-phosphate 3-epimerase [Calditrichia bacterium]
MNKQLKIAPSILSANFACLEEEIGKVEAGGADMIHVDVMDGHFVPNLTIGPVVVQAIRPVTKLPLDVHLMIEKPERYIDVFADAGANYLTVQAEATVHLHRTLQAIRARGMKAGVALNPHTLLSAVEEVLAEMDLILIMSVNPGFGGQTFIPHTIDKLRRTQKLLQKSNMTHIEVEVDGGVKLDNIKEIAAAGAEVFVSGSGIFKTADPVDTVRQMKDVLKITGSGSTG